MGSDPGGHGHGAGDAIGHLRQDALQNRRRLAVVGVVGFLVVVVELVAGYWANSLVLLADATHYATDLMAVLLAYIAVGWAMRPATRQKTFGFQRAEVVSAFIQSVALWVVGAVFLWESYERLRAPPEVDGDVVLVVGLGTLVVNLALAGLLYTTPSRSLNLRAAYLHILSDVLGSAAAVLTGLLIKWKGWRAADPALTLIITLLLLVFAWRLTRQSLHILLEGAPTHVDPADVEASLRGIEGVRDVHDLHLWTLTSGADSLSAHVVLDRAPQGDRISHEVHARVAERYGIDHVTVQVESPECPCTMRQHKWAARRAA